VKLGLSWSVTFFTVQVVKVFCYFSGFPDELEFVGADIGYEFCSLEVTALCSLSFNKWLKANTLTLNFGPRHSSSG
jgi:hypothetical protein